MPYVVRRRGDKWGCWNKGSSRWMAEKPQSFQRASAQCSAVRASEESDWEPTGKKARRYKRKRWGVNPPKKRGK